MSPRHRKTRPPPPAPRNSYNGRPLLSDGKALTGEVVARIRGHRHQDAFARGIGVTGRTVRRMETGGATVHQALAIAGAELLRCDVQRAAYTLAMIGEPLPLHPAWSATPPPWSDR